MDAAAVAARLCEVGADGTSVLVSKGILNATRREGMAEPVPLSDTPMQLDFHFVSAPSFAHARGARPSRPACCATGRHVLEAGEGPPAATVDKRL